MQTERINKIDRGLGCIEEIYRGNGVGIVPLLYRGLGVKCNTVAKSCSCARDHAKIVSINHMSGRYILGVITLSMCKSVT